MNKPILTALIALSSLGALSSCNMMKKNTEKTSADNSIAQLTGSWELNYITGIRIAFNGLYPDAKPSISFGKVSGEMNGNTSCNVFGSKVTISGNKLSVSEPGAMTMRHCEGEGERRFLDMLKKVDSYEVKDNVLTLSQGDLALMRFAKK